MSDANPQARVVREIRKLHAEMTPLMLLAGVQQESLDKPIESLDDVSFDTAAAILNELQTFRAGAYEECRAYKHQRSDEFWTNLVVIFNNRNLPEQQILNRHYKAVRQAWRKLYGRGPRNGATDVKQKPERGPVKD